jgi:hypothetical protein
LRTAGADRESAGAIDGRKVGVGVAEGFEADVGAFEDEG